MISKLRFLGFDLPDLHMQAAAISDSLNILSIPLDFQKNKLALLGVTSLF